MKADKDRRRTELLNLDTIRDRIASHNMTDTEYARNLNRTIAEIDLLREAIVVGRNRATRSEQERDRLQAEVERLTEELREAKLPSIESSRRSTGSATPTPTRRSG